MMKSILHNLSNLIVIGSLILTGYSTVYAKAKEPDIVRESIRARGMGNAFIATANDDMVLYYNPAGLRSVTHNMYSLLSIGATVNDSIFDLFGLSIDGMMGGDFEAETKDVEAQIAEIPGDKLYFELDLGFLGHTNSRWGFTTFGNTVVDMAIHNPVVPFFDVRFFAQSGIIFGMGFSFMDYQLDMGVSIKAMGRAGMTQELHISDPAIVEFLNDRKTDELAKLADATTAVAPDVGFTYHIERMHNLSPKLSVVVRNIGDLDFGAAGKIPMTIDTGIATTSEIQGFDITLAADYRDWMNAQALVSETTPETGDMLSLTDRNLKIGAEIGYNKTWNGHHLISVRVGSNGPYQTMGFTLNLYLVKLDFAQWSEEIGEFGGDQEDKRITTQLSFQF